jgi:hypothetical protein
MTFSTAMENDHHQTAFGQHTSAHFPVESVQKLERQLALISVLNHEKLVEASSGPDIA